MEYLVTGKEWCRRINRERKKHTKPSEVDNKKKRMCNENDIIDHPPHYAKSDIEPIDVIYGWSLNYNLGNVIKYVCRHKHKGKPLEDLKKAMWYLEEEIRRMSQDEEA